MIIIKEQFENATRKDKNSLIFEKNPYLLAHAHNPVDWYPWSDYAFEHAKKLDRPVLLSIGYSSCHWCHVMARESFEDEEVAYLMNQSFVNVKVDREERPDIDSVYMKVCQLMTGTGGWPLTVIMTPDKMPFFIATYIPKESKYGQPGIKDVITKINLLWEKERNYIYQLAEKAENSLKIENSNQNNKLPDSSVFDNAFNELAGRFDAVNGGFGSAPKFPMLHQIMFLMRYSHNKNDKQALEIALHTLDKMMMGGIFDQIGYGFHRYSTDEMWILPHFEKMLYDQAMFIMAYTEAYQITKDAKYKDTAEKIIHYVMNNLYDTKNKAFYSSQNAESEGEEGKFYLWKYHEVRDILDEDDFNIAVKIFNIKSDGNFVDPVYSKNDGDNILYNTKNYDDILYEISSIKTDESPESVYERITGKLYEHRNKRISPEIDDKILVDWNGLIIVALAKAGAVFHKEDHIDAAQDAADFIFKNLTDENNDLVHSFRGEKSSIPAFLDDYAFLIWAMIELYQACFNSDYLEKAAILTDKAAALFWDKNSSGFFISDNKNSDLIVNQKDYFDNAMPSGSSVMALNLAKLGKMTDNGTYLDLAYNTIQAASNLVSNYPTGFTHLISSLMFLAGKSYQVIIAGKRNDERVVEMIDTLHNDFHPDIVIHLNPVDEEEPSIHKMVKYMKGMGTVEGVSTAYVCDNYACKSPATSIDELKKQLENSTIL